MFIIKYNHNTSSCFSGFTLLELLIALFIFSIVGLILSNALHNVLVIDAKTEEAAKRLTTLQRVFLLLSNDIEQVVNRSVKTTNGEQEEAFVGTTKYFFITHGGYASLNQSLTHSTLQRVAYRIVDQQLWRLTWDRLDQAPQSQFHKKLLLTALAESSFQYLDNDKHWHTVWPDGKSSIALPCAIKIHFRLTGQGEIEQVYVVPAQGQKIVSV